MRWGFPCILLIIYTTAVSSASRAVPFLSKTIRVAIHSDLKNFKLKGENIKIFDFERKRNLKRWLKHNTINFIYINSNNLYIEKESYNSKHLIIYSKKKLLSINGKPYRGIFDIYLTSAGFLIVNHVNLEKYLASVLNKEMKHDWPMETLKAQAVAARTYALACMIENIDKKYDVVADVYDQVYSGSKHEAERTVKAVQLSRGEILTFKGQVWKTYYHANSGGHTENPSKIWGGRTDYMPAVSDPYSFNLPGYSWSFKLSIKDLTRILKNEGLAFNTLFDIDASSYTNSGRVEKVKIRTENKNYYLTGKQFREMLGFSKLKSTKFIITSKNESEIEFVGRGLGHGAGMSQWGAKKLGESGKSYKEILKTYYPKLLISKKW